MEQYKINIATIVKVLVANGIEIVDSFVDKLELAAAIPADVKIALTGIVKTRYHWTNNPEDVATEVLRLIDDLTTLSWEEFGYDQTALSLPALTGHRSTLLTKLVAHLVGEANTLVATLTTLLSDPTNFQSE